ncbi:hypothetical protein HMI54_003909, partial [Coelomomyces lativittatus]
MVRHQVPNFLKDPMKAKFSGKLILAPMVRIGSLPMRMLAKFYGADLVFGPEIVDKRIIGSQRIVNEALGTIDYVKQDTLNFRCLASEKPYLVFQLGTAHPDLALEAAKLVAQDVAFIDVNCGCPKPFSIQGGMGAALLSTPDTLCQILETLVQFAGVPITAKIRLLSSTSETLALVARLIKTGISALTIHGRTRHDRPRDPSQWDKIESIARQFGDQLPIVANGDIFTPEDIEKAFKIP